ncbi:MAG: hypothetical protein HY854_20545 [Burkholderiales bacterium]|nr:hypothetical protein [Burkholderiales bacterium]
MAQLDAPIARGIWTSLRVREGVAIIRRLHETRNIPLSENLDEALGHLITINGIRDGLLHYGAPPDNKGRRAVSTEMYARSEESLIEFRVSVPMLNALTHDLDIIINRMLAGTARPKDKASQPWYDRAELRARDPFLYTQPSPAPKGRKTPSSAQSRTPRQKSSERTALRKKAAAEELKKRAKK